MSSHRPHHEIAPQIQAPPPPVLSRQGGRPIRRTRSRSRSPRNVGRSRSNSNRYSNRQDVREDRGSISSREQREITARRGSGGGGGRTRRQSRSRSPSPFADPANYIRSSNKVLPHGGGGGALLNHSIPSTHLLTKPQSINLIAGEALPIIRRILDPELVKIPRRIGEGSRPIFDREELKEGLRRRFAADEDEQRSTSPNPAVPHPSQRVIAIIREPAHNNSRTGIEGGDDSFRRLPSSSTSSKDLAHLGFGGGRNRPNPQLAVHEHQQHHQQRDRPTSTSNYQPRQQRSISPPTLHRGSSGGGGPRTGDREERQTNDRGGRGAQVRSRSKDRVERVERDRPPTQQQQHHLQNPRRNQGSPVRILRDRITRSHSRTPPPMPAEIRKRLIIERERDLRSKLSRPAGGRFPGKFDANQQHEFRGGDSNYSNRGTGFIRGRGGFRGRGRWHHDLFEDGDLKTNKT